MADTDYKDQISQKGAEQRKCELLNIEITCNQTSHEQYAVCMWWCGHICMANRVLELFVGLQ